MNMLAKPCSSLALLGALPAAAIQPVEVGLQPVHARIRDAQADMYALSGQFSSDTTTQAERNALGRKLVEIMTERKALEAEVQYARGLSRSPLIMYVAPGKSTK